MPRSTPLKSLTALVLVIAAAACSKADGGDDGFATTPGQSVAVAGLISATFASRGGGLPGPRPEGAVCDPHVWTYGYHPPGASLSWSRCRVANSGQEAADYTSDSGYRALSPSEQSDVDAALRAVRVSARSTCGADKDYWSLTLVAPGGSRAYGDDFYACVDGEFMDFVRSDDLGQLYSTLTPLAHE
jgi:hypothetical protein